MGDRDDGGYWGNLASARLRRRRLLAISAGAGTLAVAAACGSTKRSSQPATSASGQAAAGMPRSGGTLNVYQTSNQVLDAQKSSAAAQRTIGGVQSRIFRFKTGLDPKVA